MKRLISIPLLLSVIDLFAQNDRVNDYNYLNWIQTFNTISLNKKWSLHLEYQWRRTEGLKYWQQSLLRIGTNYKLDDNVTVHVGYGWIETFPYGDYPIANNGTFPEHRIYEQISFRQPINKFLFMHRFRIEQRWLGRVTPATDREIEDWVFLHRFRYQFRSSIHFIQKGINSFMVPQPMRYLLAQVKMSAQIFLIRTAFSCWQVISLINGYSLEGGYFNQTLQQGRRVNDKTIMQRNNGWVLSSYLNL